MADTVTTKWLYPVNWDGSYQGDGNPSPPDHWHGWKRMKVQFTNYSDGTGESGVIKLNRSDFRGVQGGVCTKIGIKKITWTTFGMGFRLFWDMNPLQTIVVAGQGSEKCLTGPWYPDVINGTEYGEGETGDLLLTTNDHTANDSYDITMEIIVKE